MVMLHLLGSVCEVLVIVNSQQELGKVWGRMMALDGGKHTKQQRRLSSEFL